MSKANVVKLASSLSRLKERVAYPGSPIRYESSDAQWDRITNDDQLAEMLADDLDADDLSGKYIVDVNYTLWGDYCGGTVERANCKWFEDNYAANEDSALHAAVNIDYRGFYSYSVTVDLYELWLASKVDQGEIEELFEAIRGLENYCVIDDQLLCEVEEEIRASDWDSFARDEFRDVVVNILPAIEEVLDDMSAEEEEEFISTLFHGLDCSGVLCVEAETAVNMYWRFDRIGPQSKVDTYQHGGRNQTTVLDYLYEALPEVA